MFLRLNHQKLDVYTYSRAFTLACYKLTKAFPSEEKFGMISQIRRAALSVKLNLAEGCTRKSAVERKRYLVMSRGSVVEIDAVIEVAFDLNYIKKEDIERISELLNKCFAMLSKMIG